MSFALVYWLKSCTSSVLDVHSIPTSSVGDLSVNDVVCAPLGLDYHTAKILKISDDLDLLENMEVSGDGEIIGTSIDITESMDKAMSKKIGEVQSDEADDCYNKENWNGSFESDSYVDRSPPPGMKTKIALKRSSQNEMNETNPGKKPKHDEKRLLAVKRQTLKKDSIREIESNLLLNSHRESKQSCPTTTESRRSVNHPIREENKKVFKVETADGSIKVEELQRGSGVHIDYEQLKSMKAKFANNPNEMIRQLLRMLIGIDELKEMTALGLTKGNTVMRKGIPSHILQAVKSFVDRKCSPVLEKTKYHKVINKYCDRLRNPRKPKGGEPVGRNKSDDESQ